MSVQEPERIYYYRIDRDGRLWHEGSIIDDPSVLRLFFRTMKKTDDGRDLVMCQGESNYIESDDVPYVVQNIAVEEGRDELQKVTLELQGNYTELLDPSTLRVGPENVLYCSVRRGAYPARFSRKAYHELSRWVKKEETAERYYLSLAGQRYSIQGVKP